MINKSKKQQLLRHNRVRKTVSGTPERPRLVVTRSNANIFVQVVDDTVSKTLASASTYKLKGPKNEQAEQVGLNIAAAAKAKKIKKVVFDRGGYKFHGRIKLVADKAREGGLEF